MYVTPAPHRKRGFHRKREFEEGNELLLGAGVLVRYKEFLDSQQDSLDVSKKLGFDRNRKILHDRGQRSTTFPLVIRVLLRVVVFCDSRDSS
jgi:hypothetical protein